MCLWYGRQNKPGRHLSHALRLSRTAQPSPSLQPKTKKHYHPQFSYYLLTFAITYTPVSQSIFDCKFQCQKALNLGSSFLVAFWEQLLVANQIWSSHADSCCTFSRRAFLSRCARCAFMSSELAHSSLKNDGSVYLFKHAPAAPATSNLEQYTHVTLKPNSSLSHKIVRLSAINQ
jgi:hypothetical protein